jgi:hypothetical protein
VNNTGAGQGATQFLSEALSLLGAQHRIRCVRADSGFYADSLPTRLVSFASNFGNWKSTRRFVVVREEVQSNKAAVGRKLIDLPGYAFRVFVYESQLFSFGCLA